jgi:hypothetical protein
MTVRKKSRRSSENRTNSSVSPWKSPITSDLIVAQSITLSEARLGGEQVYLLEGRPQELGRFVVVRANSLGGQGQGHDAETVQRAHSRGAKADDQYLLIGVKQT